MSEIQRASASDDDWATAPAEPRPVGEMFRAQPGDPLRAVNALIRIEQDAERLSRYAPGAADILLARLAADDVAAMIAAIQDLRRALGVTEAYLARALGRDDMAAMTGTLSDGRIWECRRGATRKAWEHEAWKRDVRAQVMSGVRAVVDVDTGEPVALGDLLAAVQEVHGSAAPKVGPLKRLGLDPDSYCESYPGPFSVQVSAPGGAE